MNAHATYRTTVIDCVSDRLAAGASVEQSPRAHQLCTYSKWQWKTNPKFPSPEKVRDEIIQMLKGLGAAAIAPAASVIAARIGWNKAYCGSAPIDNALARGSFSYHFATGVAVILVSDFWEFYYHYLGHKYKMFWE